MPSAGIHVHGLLAAVFAALPLLASEQHGQVIFNGLPVPGATVIAVHEGKTVEAITDSQGLYSLSGLDDGVWGLEVRMPGFEASKREIAVTANAPAEKWELKLLPLDQIRAEIQHAPQARYEARSDGQRQQEPPKAPAARADAPDQDDLSQRAADGFLINGSMNNGAASPFAQAAAFGNNRYGGRRLYNGGIGITFDNSALDARPFSLTGQDTPKAAYNRMTGLLTLGGPLQIPHLFTNGPNFFLGYQWTRNNNATTAPALMPGAAERNGIFASPVVDPLTGAPFPGNVIPDSRISPQARALRSLYPLPNFDSAARYNFQIPLLSPTHQDALESRLSKAINSKNQVYGGFAFQSTRVDNPNLFRFLDATDTLGMNASVNWSHRLSTEWFLNAGYQFSRLATHVTSNFENRINVSGQAGISGNNQDPMNWGPPSLVFSSGIAGLSDAQSSFDRNQTSGLAYSMLWNHRAHNITFGGDFRRHEFNYLSQQDPRGTFTFTGDVTGSDFADFLLGIPDTISIASGNADKYFRESVYDAYFTDDWRINSELTINAGARWEYSAPVTELYNRLVNLDIGAGFSSVTAVKAADAAAQGHPRSLIRPDRNGFEPRVGIAWRPLAASSMIVRAGYGVYYDTSVYQTIALEMAQQPPLSKTFRVPNRSSDPLTLEKAFNAPEPVAANTFAADPNFRAGYAQNWQFSVQRDLPGALQMTATYLGIKGTRGMQEFLPNTYPSGADNPCPACPRGFAYLTSNGNSTRESAAIQLRRRLRSGFAATLQYTFSKSIDDDAALGGFGGANGQQAGQNAGGAPGASGSGAGASSAPTGMGGLAMAQNWLDLRAERGLSTFDQRHLLSLQLQYTTGMGMRGGTLLSGWKGALLKDWNIATQIAAGSGLPQTPIYLAPVEGTGFTGTIRPNYTGALVTAAPAGLFLNPAAYTAPLPGQWGNAGRGTITGPAQFTLNASLGRTFRVSDRLNLDVRVDSTNALNHVAYTAWDTTINNKQFGLPAAANAMRALQTTVRLRF